MFEWFVQQPTFFFGTACTQHSDLLANTNNYHALCTNTNTHEVFMGLGAIVSRAFVYLWFAPSANFTHGRVREPTTRTHTPCITADRRMQSRGANCAKGTRAIINDRCLPLAKVVCVFVCVFVRACRGDRVRTLTERHASSAQRLRHHLNNVSNQSCALAYYHSRNLAQPSYSPGGSHTRPPNSIGQTH